MTKSLKILNILSQKSERYKDLMYFKTKALMVQRFRLSGGVISNVYLIDQGVF
jgi:hypothetical protein